jgi:hypothetical protein
MVKQTEFRVLFGLSGRPIGDTKLRTMSSEADSRRSRQSAERLGQSIETLNHSRNMTSKIIARMFNVETDEAPAVAAGLPMSSC